MDVKAGFKVSLIPLLMVSPLTLFGQDTVFSFGQGMTLGAGVGATTFMTNTSSNMSMGSASGNDNNPIYKYGVMGDLFAGYGRILGCTYLGAELGVNFLGANKTTQNQTSQANVVVVDTSLGSNWVTDNLVLNSQTTTKRNSVEPFLDLKAGFLMAPNAIAYLRGGISYNTLKIHQDANFQAVGQNGGDALWNQSAAATTSYFSHSQKRKLLGLRVGAGLEYMIQPQLGLGANYIYTFYRHINGSSASGANDVACDVFEGCVASGANAANTNSAKAYDQQAMAALIYHFN